MKVFFPKNHEIERGEFLHSAPYSTHDQKINILFKQDTLAQAEDQAEKSSNAMDLRVQLPHPKPILPQDDLMILADAFCAAYNSMNQSVITQVQDYTQLQQLDQTQAKAVLDSATNAINKEKAAEKTAAEVAKYQSQLQEVNKDFSDVMIAFGFILLFATFVAGALSGGAADAGLPEELEMINMGTPEVASDLDSGAEADDELFALSDNEFDSMDDLDFSDDETAEVETTQQSTNETTESSQAQNLKSEESLLKKAGKLGLKLGFGAVFGSPMLLQGVSNILISQKLGELAKAQAGVGAAIALQQSNNMFFQFVQQLLQREGSVTTEETDDSSEVIDTFASITNAYRAIPQGLANAV